MANKNQIASPFENQLLPGVGESRNSGAVVNKNVCPYFSHPRDVSPGDEPDIFFEGVGPKKDTYHGDIEGKAVSVSSTMGGKK